MLSCADDISIRTDPKNENLDPLENVLTAFFKHVIKLEQLKCHFGRGQIEISEHEVAPDGMLLSDEHGKKI